MVDFTKVCKVARKAILPYLGQDKEVLIALCRDSGKDIDNVHTGNVVVGNEKFVRGLLYCKNGLWWGSVHNHPTREAIPSFVDIYHYLSGALGGYMCIASEKTGKLACYWLTKKYHTPEVKKLVDIVNKAIEAYNEGDKETYKKYVIRAKKFIMKFKCCEIQL